MDRRNFLKTLPVSFFLPVYIEKNYAYGSDVDAKKSEKNNKLKSNKLILVELKGGNDGINTLIPFKDKQYYKNRPKIGIKENEVLSLGEGVGMHPSLKKLVPIWEKNQMAWIQGIGYEKSSRSHFRAIEIWDTTLTEEDADNEGWVSKLLKNRIKGVAINTNMGPLYNDDLSSVRINTPQQFAKLGEQIKPSSARTNNPSLSHIIKVQNSVDQLADIFLQKLPGVPKPYKKFPKGKFGRDLETVYTLIASGLDVPAYKVSLGGFDTHTNQLSSHANRLSLLADGLATLMENLLHVDLWDSTLVMSYSEFGRRLEENAGKGTDHGAASSHFVMGGAVKGGLYGKYPSLTKLDERGDLIHNVDFRDVYASVAKGWWGIGDKIENRLNFI